MICERCKKDFDGEEIKDASGTLIATVGYYKDWFELVRERIICDACMWADPHYISVYGVNNALRRTDTT